MAFYEDIRQDERWPELIALVHQGETTRAAAAQARSLAWRIALDWDVAIESVLRAAAGEDARVR